MIDPQLQACRFLKQAKGCKDTCRVCAHREMQMHASYMTRNQALDHTIILMYSAHKALNISTCVHRLLHGNELSN